MERLLEQILIAAPLGHQDAYLVIAPKILSGLEHLPAGFADFTASRRRGHDSQSGFRQKLRLRLITREERIGHSRERPPLDRPGFFSLETLPSSQPSKGCACAHAGASGCAGTRACAGAPRQTAAVSLRWSVFISAKP